MPNISSSRHYPALDGLRGLAALLIVWNHFLQLVPAHGRVLSGLSRAFGFAWAGVDLFFVLSGFLITGILLDTRSNSHYFRSFYVRRILRIFPLYFAFLAIILLVLPRLGVAIGVPASSGVYFWTYLSNFYFASSGWSANYLSHTWTLAIEEQFYLIWPLVLYHVTRLDQLRIWLLRAIALVIVLRVILSMMGVGFQTLELMTFTHCDALLLGSYLGIACRSESVAQWLKPKTGHTLVVAILALIFCDGPWFIPNWENLTLLPLLRSTIMLSLLALISFWLISQVIGEKKTRTYRIFSTPMLRWVGKYSYALYILHVPLAFAILGPVFPYLSSNALLAEAESCILYFSASICAAYLSWHLFEKYFLKLKRYFPRSESSTLAVVPVES